jgi:Predicted 3'-5' exonuclease related to the exonuclease domain of PolB
VIYVLATVPGPGRSRLARPHRLRAGGGCADLDPNAAFCDKVSLTPQLVTFNGNSFDLPVLRYRAMVHGISAPGAIGAALLPPVHRRRQRSVRRPLVVHSEQGH